MFAQLAEHARGLKPDDLLFKAPDQSAPRRTHRPESLPDPDTLGLTKPNDKVRRYRHGTTSGYGAGACRCQHCKDASIIAVPIKNQHVHIGVLDEPRRCIRRRATTDEADEAAGRRRDRAFDRGHAHHRGSDQRVGHPENAPATITAGWLARPDADHSKVGCKHGDVDVGAASRAEAGLEPGRGQHREQRDEHTQQREVGAVREGVLGGVDVGWCRRRWSR
jgi:hypothetical protein